MQPAFNEAEIRTAERALAAAFEAADPTAWVYVYTEDALFVGPGGPAVQGREALLGMARAMTPLSSMSIQAQRTEGSENLAYAYGAGSWVSGPRGSGGARVEMRFVMVWRKEADGQWRVALEMLNPPPASA